MRPATYSKLQCVLVICCTHASGVRQLWSVWRLCSLATYSSSKYISIMEGNMCSRLFTSLEDTVWV